jgi:hypothetical protein
MFPSLCIVDLTTIVLSLTLSHPWPNLDLVKTKECVSVYRDASDSTYLGLFPLQRGADGEMYYSAVRETSISEALKSATLAHDSFHDAYRPKNSLFRQKILFLDTNGNHIIEPEEAANWK